MTRLAAFALALALVTAVGLTRAGPATAQSEDIFELLPAADLANGERQYNRCLGCHVIEPGQPSRAGPNLWGVFGRDIASADGFRYSQALTVLEGRWDVASLEHYLTDPRGFAPGTRKTLPGPRRTSDRADLIAWLASQSDNPIAPEDLVLDDLDMALLPRGPGREDTFYACIACHSIRIVAQQGLSREAWEETLDWMVEEQAMDPLDPELHETVLTYLADYLGTDHRPQTARR